MKMYRSYILLVLFSFVSLNVESSINSQIQANLISQYNGDLFPYPEQCHEILNKFGQYASNFTLCSILNARPITLCERCVDHYVKFRDKYQELLNTTVNGTSCRSVYLSQDRLNAIQEYHDNILSIWNKGNCNGCFNWTEGIPTLKNDITIFHKKLNNTKNCINSTNDDVCDRCMSFYVKLDDFYKSLSTDSIGIDSVCMDIVDSMNATRSIWSKSLNCCNLRRTPEVIFLCSAVIISFLPILYYVVLRYFAPIRDLPNVLKQSRFKQTILRSINRRSSD